MVWELAANRECVRFDYYIVIRLACEIKYYLKILNEVLN